MDEVEEAYKKGQPVLVGTINIDTSELVSSMLNKRGIPHKVLNAKFHELEAEIVAQAGVHGAVTIATNMAGRGTDIKLDDEAKEAGGLKSSVLSVMNPDVLITSCEDVPVVRETRENPSSSFHWKMI